MPAISQAIAEQKLAMWLDALDALALGQSYSMNGKTLTRANLADVEKQISFWEKRVNRAARGGVAVSEVVPRG